jgi:hypothetical protein
MVSAVWNDDIFWGAPLLATAMARSTAVAEHGPYASLAPDALAVVSSI